VSNRGPAPRAGRNYHKICVNSKPTAPGGNASCDQPPPRAAQVAGECGRAAAGRPIRPAKQPASTPGRPLDPRPPRRGIFHPHPAGRRENTPGWRAPARCGEARCWKPSTTRPGRRPPVALRSSGFSISVVEVTFRKIPFGLVGPNIDQGRSAFPIGRLATDPSSFAGIVERPTSRVRWPQPQPYETSRVAPRRRSHRHRRERCRPWFWRSTTRSLPLDPAARKRPLRRDSGLLHQPNATCAGSRVEMAGPRRPHSRAPTTRCDPTAAMPTRAPRPKPRQQQQRFFRRRPVMTGGPGCIGASSTRTEEPGSRCGGARWREPSSPAASTGWRFARRSLRCA